MLAALYSQGFFNFDGSRWCLVHHLFKILFRMTELDYDLFSISDLIKNCRKIASPYRGFGSQTFRILNIYMFLISGTL